QLKPRADGGEGPAPARRAPVRPRGPARARPLSQVQAERAAREAAWAERPPGPRSAPDGARQDEAPGRARPPRARPTTTSPPAPRRGPPREAAPGPRSQPRADAPRPPRPPRTPAPARPEGAGLRLNKRLADLGLCSRREADEW